MALTLLQIKKYRNWFGAVFFISTLFILIPLWVIKTKSMPHVTAAPLHGPAPIPSLNLTALTTVASLLISCTTLLGFVFTTVIAWRKDRRESLQAQIDVEKKKLEIEALQHEIQKLKSNNRGR